MTIIARQVELVSVSASGALGNSYSGYNALTVSRDGSLVGFATYASNLWSPDSYNTEYAIKNMATGGIQPITLPVSGTAGGGASPTYDAITLSGDGSFVTFGSTSNLLGSSSDTGGEDIFKLNLSDGELTITSLPQGGVKSYHSTEPDISDNGRYVVFTSMDNLLATTDRNGSSDTDVYWCDTQTGTLRMVSGEFDGSLQGGGDGTEGDSYAAHVTNDGRWVLFQSKALNLRPDATGGASMQLFLRDMVDDELYLLSTDPNGAPGDGTSDEAEITPDGRFVVFSSRADNLTDADSSGYDILRLDLYSGQIAVANTSASGVAYAGGTDPEITPDGRYIVFESSELQIVPGSTGTGSQIFVKDMVTGGIEMVSTDVSGTGTANGAYAPQISDDGQYIVFNTRSALLSSDNNGYDDVYRVLNPLYAWGTNLENDTFANSPEAETISGGEGRDLVVYSSEKSQYTLTKTTEGYNVTTANITDSLSSVERLQFYDMKVAFDVGTNENAGRVAKLLGAVFGTSAVTNKSYAGIGLSYLDGGMSYNDLAQLAIDVTGMSTSQQIVNLLWTNVVGSAPTAEQAQPFVDMLNSGMTSGALTVLAADTDINQNNINLSGLAQTGLEYI